MEQDLISVTGPPYKFNMTQLTPIVGQVVSLDHFILMY